MVELFVDVFVKCVDYGIDGKGNVDGWDCDGKIDLCSDDDLVEDVVFELIGIGLVCGVGGY